jgi:hypothetical protein
MYVSVLTPAILREIKLRPVLPTQERMVLRATILVPQRSTPVIAENR